MKEDGKEVKKGGERKEVKKRGVKERRWRGKEVEERSSRKGGEGKKQKEGK